jgi:hypothetical protein
MKPLIWYRIQRRASIVSPSPQFGKSVSLSSAANADKGVSPNSIKAARIAPRIFYFSLRLLCFEMVLVLTIYPLKKSPFFKTVFAN